MSLLALAAVLLSAPPADWRPPVTLDLPAAAGNGELAPTAPEVWLGKDRLVLRVRDPQRKAWKTTTLVEFDGAFPASAIAHGVLVEPLAEALPPARRADPINLLIDAEADHQTATRLLYTCGQAGYGDFRLAIADPARSALVIHSPKAVRVPPDTPPSLGLRVTLTGGRAQITAPGGDVLTPLGCPEAPEHIGCAIGRDGAALTAAARTVKAAFPDADAVYLAADPDTRWKALVEAAAALREADGKPLFPGTAFVLP